MYALIASFFNCQNSKLTMSFDISLSLLSNSRLCRRGRSNKRSNQSKPLVSIIKMTLFKCKYIRPRVVDLSFIVILVHRKIEVLLCCINFDYTINFAKNVLFFYFFSFEYKKKKRKIHSIMLQNLLFDYSNIFYELYEL